MAKTKKQNAASVPSQNKFAESLVKIGYRFSLAKVFEDFLTMSIAACTQNFETKISYYEEEYLQTIAAYKDSELRHEFPKAFASLVLEMEERVHSEHGNDVLGEFFEEHFAQQTKGQIFTPPSICTFMATAIAVVKPADTEETRPLRIFDPACGSGRMLLAAYRVHGSEHKYYGIDIDLTCVKMTALNLFLNGMWNSEVMCADALRPDDFVIAYHISLFPFGIFKIQEKEHSILWNMHRSSFSKKDTDVNKTSLNIQPIEINNSDSTQLNLF